MRLWVMNKKYLAFLGNSLNKLMVIPRIAISTKCG